MMTPKKLILLWELECRHLAPALETMAETHLYCVYHNANIRVVGIHLWEWRAFCTKCKFSRWTGTSKDNANMLANSHDRNNPAHGKFIQLEYTVRPEAVHRLSLWRQNGLGAKPGTSLSPGVRPRNITVASDMDIRRTVEKRTEKR